MVITQKDIPDLRDIFTNAITKIFIQKDTSFLDYLENEEYSYDYDCYIRSDEENYIINRCTGEYINCYNITHLARDIRISITTMDKENINRENVIKWMEDFLTDFKKGEEEW